MSTPLTINKFIENIKALKEKIDLKIEKESILYINKEEEEQDGN